MGRADMTLRPRPTDGFTLIEVLIALALAVLVILFFAVTLVKGPVVLQRPI